MNAAANCGAKLLIGTVMAACLLLSSPSDAQTLSEPAEQSSELPWEQVGDGLSVVQEMEVRELIKSFIQANPQLIYETMQSGMRRGIAQERNRLEAERAQREITALADYALSDASLARLFDDDRDPVLGPADEDASVVVYFYDYACIFCKVFKSTMSVFQRENPDVRFILKELPIMGPDSRLASRVSLYLAARDEAHFREFNDVMMRRKGLPDKASIDAVLDHLGYDAQAVLQEISSSPELDQHIDDTIALSRELGIKGTPAVVVNETLFRKVPSLQELEQALGSS